MLLSLLMFHLVLKFTSLLFCLWLVSVEHIYLSAKEVMCLVVFGCVCVCHLDLFITRITGFRHI